MKEQNNKRIILLRIVLTALWLVMIGFIFFNSSQTGEQSAARSSTLTDTVQQVVSVVAPQSPIATAKGEAYDRLHNCVRVWAHFIEFAALGVLTCWGYFSYTNRKKYLFAPILTLVFVPFLDEWSQTFSVGRGAEWQDCLIDVAGGLLGFLLALLALVIVGYYYKKRRALRALYDSVKDRMRQLSGGAV